MARLCDSRQEGSTLDLPLAISPSVAQPKTSQTVRNVLSELRRYANARRDATLEKARQMLTGGRSPESALEFLANTLTNKLMHAPSANLRAAGLRGDFDLWRRATQLFDSKKNKVFVERDKNLAEANIE